MEERITVLKVEEIKKDPNSNLKEKVRNIIKEGMWLNKLKSIFRNEASNTHRLFGKLKDHKIPNKMRPIVNKRDGPRV